MKNNSKLSILIPCYNWDISNFVQDLYTQCKREYKAHFFEIICIDDASLNCYQNEKIIKMNEVKYKKLPQNIGRSAIRNLLAKQAKFKWLLFIDCDSKIANTDFIKNYKKKTENRIEDRIYYGNTLYETNTDKNKILHYKYGKNIESIQKEKYFSSHHFLIKKIDFNNITFDEKLKKYGYEDVLFQIQSNYNFEYINNPLYHSGLKNTDDFLLDCEQGLRNLCNYTDNNYVVQKIKILKWWKKSTIAHNCILKIFQHFKSVIINNLKSKQPILFLFQFYKLGLFIYLKSQIPENRK